MASQQYLSELIADVDLRQVSLYAIFEAANRVASRYPTTDQSLPAKYARAIAAYRAVDIKAALTQTDELIAIEPDNPYFHELKGQILFESGRAAESVPDHRRSVELAPQHALLKVNLARSLIGTKDEKDLAEAEGLLMDAIQLEHDNSFAWNQLAVVYGRMDRIGDADLATAEEAYYRGDMARAYVFARRAVDKLDPNTPNGRRADDIAALADPRIQPRGGRQGFSGVALAPHP